MDLVRLARVGHVEPRDQLGPEFGRDLETVCPLGHDDRVDGGWEVRASVPASGTDPQSWTPPGAPSRTSVRDGRGSSGRTELSPTSPATGPEPPLPMSDPPVRPKSSRPRRDARRRTASPGAARRMAYHSSSTTTSQTGPRVEECSSPLHSRPGPGLPSSAPPGRSPRGTRGALRIPSRRAMRLLPPRTRRRLERPARVDLAPLVDRREGTPGQA